MTHRHSGYCVTAISNSKTKMTKTLLLYPVSRILIHASIFSISLLKQTHFDIQRLSVCPFGAISTSFDCSDRPKRNRMILCSSIISFLIVLLTEIISSRAQQDITYSLSLITVSTHTWTRQGNNSIRWCVGGWRLDNLPKLLRDYSKVL